MAWGPLPFRPSLGLWLGLIGLQAQDLPPVPIPTPGSNSPEAVELIPLRPAKASSLSALAPRVLRWRGEMVKETADLWVLQQGALEGDEILLLADLIQYEPATGKLRAQGRIRLEAVGIRLRCERLEMDWGRNTGQAWQLELELPPSWNLKSAHVLFQNLRHWEFDRVTVSPCPERKPGWKADLSSLKLDLDGFAIMRNPLLHVGSVPVLYLPWAAYPAKPERSSGLLPLSMGASSSLGFSIGVPYYQVLGPTMDATLAPEYYTKAGMLWGGEFRWAPDPTHQGLFKGQSIVQKTDGEHRYRYSVKELWQREDGWQFSADVNQASDSLMDVDYGKGASNFGGTSFDSALYVGRAFKMLAFSVDASEQKTFFQPEDPFYREGFPSSMRKQSLPGLQARAYPMPLGDFYLDGGVRLNRLAYRFDLGENGNITDPVNSTGKPGFQWNRADAQLRVQGRLGQWGPLRSDLQLGARYTHYGASLSSDVFDPANPVSDPAFDPFRVDGPALSRPLASARLKVSTPPIGRLYEGLSFMKFQGEVKHTLEPYLAFAMASGFSGVGTTPHFDEVDSRPGVQGTAVGEQSIEFGLKQHLLGRGGKGLPFADLVRWRASMRYHFKPIILADGRVQSGWASLDNDLDVEPNDRLRLSFRRSADVTGSGADSSLTADFKGSGGGSLSLALFSTGINQLLVRQQGIQVGGIQRFFEDRWRVQFQANYDIRIGMFASSEIALAHVTPCVGYILRYTHVATPLSTSLTKEDRIDLTLTLRGIGDLFTLRP